MVSVEEVKRLREETGAGVMDAKRALDEASGDFDAARKLLRERGIAAAAKRSERATSQGVVESYIHGGGRIGALVELNCETDFVARTDDFKGLAREIAMQVAASDPKGLSVEDLPSDLDGDREAQALLTQTYIREPSQTVQDLIQDVIAKTGENVRVSRFARFELGGS